MKLPKGVLPHDLSDADHDVLVSKIVDDAPSFDWEDDEVVSIEGTAKISEEKANDQGYEIYEHGTD